MDTCGIKCPCACRCGILSAGNWLLGMGCWYDGNDSSDGHWLLFAVLNGPGMHCW